jgi:DNA-binding SARP family transcriptional activator
MPTSATPAEPPREPAAEGIRFSIDFSSGRPLERIRECEDALQQLPGTATVDRSRVLASLAAAQASLSILEARDSASAALAAAEASGDEVALGYALLARFVAEPAPSTLERRLEDSRTALRIAEAEGTRGLAATAYFLHLAALLEGGDIRGVDAMLSVTGATLSAFPDLAESRYAKWFRCARATLDGHAGVAERLADAALEAATAAGDPDAMIVWAAQIAIVRWMQGRVSEMEPILLQARQANPDEPVWAAAVAWIWARQGRAKAAEGLVDSLPEVEAFPRDRNWLAAVAILSEVAAGLGSDALVEQLTRALSPFADRIVPIGFGVTCWGTVARPLALLARRAGRMSDAVAHYRTAIEVAARLGAQAWLAQAQSELAALLVEAPAAPEGRDSREAERLAEESAAAARHLGLQLIVEDSLAQSSRRAPEPGASAGAPEGSVAGSDRRRASVEGAAGIRVFGGFEVRSVGGHPAHWDSRKARTLLKILVAHHGAPVHRESLMELLWPGVAPERLANRMSVAVSAVRRALDPGRAFPADHFLVTDGAVLSLNADRLFIDVEEFLHRADAALDADEARLDRLTEALDAYGGEVLVDEPYAAWAEQLRREVHAAFFGCSHAVAEAATAAGDHLLAVETYRGILALDAFDQRAHEGLIEGLERLGAHGQAGEARERFRGRMSELGIAVGGA